MKQPEVPNYLFQQAATQVAFSLTLSKRNCYALLCLADETKTELERLYVLSVDALKPLDRKGLVFWHYDEEGRPCGFGGLTKAGKLVVGLLKEAGYTVEDLISPLTQKRIDRLSEKAST